MNRILLLPSIEKLNRRFSRHTHHANHETATLRGAVLYWGFCRDETLVLDRDSVGNVYTSYLVCKVGRGSAARTEKLYMPGNSAISFEIKVPW